MRKKKILAGLLVLMLSCTSPAVTIQAANEVETNAVLMTETETQTETEPVIDETELRKELANSYVRLETKYQKEKTIFRTVISVLLFVMIILFGVLGIVISYYRKKIQNMGISGARISVNRRTVKKEQMESPKALEKEIPKKKIEKTLQQAKKAKTISQEDIARKNINLKETELKKNVSEEKYPKGKDLKEKHSKENMQKEKTRKETALKENVQKTKKKSNSEKPKKIKSEIGSNGLEVFDLNDED